MPNASNIHPNVHLNQLLHSALPVYKTRRKRLFSHHPAEKLVSQKQLVITEMKAAHPQFYIPTT